jgi:S-DNA-T family DNA segregation ATPase FtsK/SpoIIIE
MIAATQRPSADIIPTSLRDLFGFRVAFRCTTDSSSDIILSVAWAKEGYSARTIRPEDVGVGFILAEGGIPRKTYRKFSPQPDRTFSTPILRRPGDPSPRRLTFPTLHTNRKTHQPFPE